MDTTVELAGRRIQVHITSAAEARLQERDTPLVAEMELFFSCLIRKKVRFHDDAATDATPVTDTLHASFRPVMTRHCSLDYEGDEPPMTEFPIVKETPFVPKWLRVDHRDGAWTGEFGYAPAG